MSNGHEDCTNRRSTGWRHPRVARRPSADCHRRTLIETQRGRLAIRYSAESARLLLEIGTTEATTVKALMAPVNIAGQPYLVTREMRKQGVDVTLLQYTMGQGHAFGYREHTTVDLSGRHRMEAQITALADAIDKGYDVFHFWMATLFGGARYKNMYGLDLPFIKMRGKKIIYRGTGFDLRTRARHMALNPHHAYQYGYSLDIDEAAQDIYIEYLRDYVDLFVVQDPEMQEHMPEARLVPRAIDLDELAPVGVDQTARPLVIHAPSNSATKGTPLILAALDELRKEGLNFDFKLISGMAHQEALEWYRRADVVIDQMLIGWYGVLTVEALSLGKPVVVYVRDDLYERFSPRIPVCNANPTNLTAKLRRVLQDDLYRMELAEAAPDFVRDVHDVRNVAKRLGDIYEEVQSMPSRQPRTFADLDHFLTQFRDLQNLDRMHEYRAKAVRYEQLLEEMPSLRFKAAQYDKLLPGLPELRAKAQKYDVLRQGQPAAVSAEAAPADDVDETGRSSDRGAPGQPAGSESGGGGGKGPTAAGQGRSKRGRRRFFGRTP